VNTRPRASLRGKNLMIFCSPQTTQSSAKTANYKFIHPPISRNKSRYSHPAVSLKYLESWTFQFQQLQKLSSLIQIQLPQTPCARADPHQHKLLPSPHHCRAPPNV
jgi:hypothetical protein